MRFISKITIQTSEDGVEKKISFSPSDLALVKQSPYEGISARFTDGWLQIIDMEHDAEEEIIFAKPRERVDHVLFEWAGEEE